jgi:hypothetical protein
MATKLFTLILAVPILGQLATLCILLFADIGFDRPGRSGLDLEDAMKLSALYVFASLFGVLFCLFQKRWRLAVAVFAVPFGTLMLLMIPKYNPQLDASQYQHLIGMSKADVKTILRGHRILTTGANKLGPFGEELEFESYNGMTVYYSKEGYVARVKATFAAQQSKFRSAAN